MTLCIQNAKLVLPSEIRSGCLVVRDGVIQEICQHVDTKDMQLIDAQGAYVTPGFIDLHVHGGGGYTLMSGEAEDVKNMCRAHLADGTTTILPTTLAAPMDVLLPAVQAVRRAAEAYTDSTLAGVHLEGPFLSPAQSGAQSPGAIIPPDLEKAQALLDAFPGGVRMMGIAPELPGAYETADFLSRHGIVVSCAHTDAAYEQVAEGVSHGFSDVTHLYSCCSTIRRVNGYRVPGVVEAGLNMDELTVQFIGDLRHLPVPLIQLILRCKGTDKAYLVTDGLEFSAATLEEGARYVQKNGMETVYEDGVMKLPHRQAFAGSVATMRRMVKNLVDQVGVSLTDAVRLAATTPAARLGLRRKGRIAVGYDADLVLLTQNLETQAVIAKGRLVKK